MSLPVLQLKLLLGEHRDRAPATPLLSQFSIGAAGRQQKVAQGLEYLPLTCEIRCGSWFLALVSTPAVPDIWEVNDRRLVSISFPLSLC